MDPSIQAYIAALLGGQYGLRAPPPQIPPPPMIPSPPPRQYGLNAPPPEAMSLFQNYLGSKGVGLGPTPMGSPTPMVYEPPVQPPPWIPSPPTGATPVPVTVPPDVPGGPSNIGGLSDLMAHTVTLEDQPGTFRARSIAPTAPTESTSIIDQIAQAAKDMPQTPEGQTLPAPERNVSAVEAAQGGDARMQSLLEKLEEIQQAERKQSRVRELARGLAEAGAGVATRGGHIYFGRRPRPIGLIDETPAELEKSQLFEKMAVAKEDPNSEISRSYREFYNQRNISVPENATAAQLESMGPGIFRMEALEAERNAPPRLKPISVDIQKTIVQTRQTIASLNKILEDFPQNKGAIGPIEGRLGKAAEFFGIADPKKAEFRRKVIYSLNQYIHAMTGAQLSYFEADRLKKGLIDNVLSDSQFEAQLRGVIEEAKRNYRISIDTAKQSGMDVSGFEGGGPGGRTFLAILKDGRKVTLSEEEAAGRDDIQEIIKELNQ